MLIQKSHLEFGEDLLEQGELQIANIIDVITAKFCFCVFVISLKFMQLQMLKMSI